MLYICILLTFKIVEYMAKKIVSEEISGPAIRKCGEDHLYQCVLIVWAEGKTKKKAIKEADAYRNQQIDATIQKMKDGKKCPANCRPGTWGTRGSHNENIYVYQVKKGLYRSHSYGLRKFNLNCPEEKKDKKK